MRHFKVRFKVILPWKLNVHLHQQTSSYCSLLDLVRTNRLRYFESSFATKRSIIDEVIQTIQSKGGRFIRMKDNYWSIITSKACQLKVAHAFRYHIRTEFSQSKSLAVSSYLTNDIINARSGPLDQISYHLGIVEDVKAKLSWLRAQQVAGELTRSNNSIGNNLHLYPYKSNFRQTEPLTTDNIFEKHECKSPSLTGIHHNVVSPFDERKVARSMLVSCDSTANMENRHVSTFPCERMNAYPLWMNKRDHYYDTHESLPRDISPSIKPNFGGDIGMGPFRPLMQPQLSHGDSASVHTSVSVPVVTDMMDRRKHIVNTNEMLCDPVSERASSHFIGNMDSFDYHEQRYDPHNQYQHINSANVIDTPTHAGRPSMYDSNVMASEIQANVIDHGKSSLVSAIYGAFDVLPFDSMRDLDPLPM